MTSPSSALNVERRRIELIQAAEETVDVLVVGGGITGVGTALDAASRGLTTTLIEAEDLAFGTSRFSSKLVHGGLRYLATGDYSTARESAQERHLLMSTIAPHLVHRLPQLLPFRPGVTMTQRAAGIIGMTMGDALRLSAGTRRSVLPPPRPVGPKTARRLAPALDPRGLRGGMLSYDGQLIDDAGLVVNVARTAAAHGAKILTRVRARSIRTDGATVDDTVSGESLEIRARSVVNATGVWAGTLDEGLTLRPSRGTHIVLDAADLGHPQAALTIPHPGSISRYVFALPQQLGRVIVGLTDEDAPGPVPAVAQPTEGEIAFLLESLNRMLAEPIRREQVRGAFAGLRPLVDTGSSSTADISRRHLVRVADEGFISVLGGKLTTYRRMSEDAVDLAARTRGLPPAPSQTATTRLVDGRSVGAPHEETSLVNGLELSRQAVEFAVRHEGAMTADDVLDRRTRIGLVDDDRERALPVVERIVDETLTELR